MQAVSHVATALILKRRFPSAPLGGLIVATEAIEYLWVGLNLLGVERTQVTAPMRSVADVYLVHMPFSHSLLTSGLLALAVGLIVFWRGGKAAAGVALALSLALASHIVLDLSVHAPDIVVLPVGDGSGLGTGLYADFPLLALGVETVWAVLCWRAYDGSRSLLALLLALEAATIPLYSAGLNVGEAALAGHETVFALIILTQMAATSGLVWVFARRSARGDRGAVGTRTRYASV